MTAAERIPTNLRTLLIVEAIGAAETPMTPAEIGRAVGLPKQTVHRLCNTLLDEGFLAFGDDGKRIRPGRRLRESAAGLLFQSSMPIARRQILLQVAAGVQETVNFAAPRLDGMVYLDRVETDWAFRIQLPIGTHVPFHCTASGKTYLANLPDTDRARFVRSLTLARHTEATLTNHDALLDELDGIARCGYAIDREELMDEMIAISVPVRAHSGRYVASLAFHGPTQRLSVDGALDHLDLMQDAARRLSDALF